MNTSLDHLPEKKQRELTYLVQVLFEEFERSEEAARATGDEHGGKILKIILFGSFARGTWVEDEKSGYQSDYDILIVVEGDYMAGLSGFWERAEDRLLRAFHHRRPLNFICHTLEDVNKNLQEGQYFFADIVKDGVELYSAPGVKFKKAKPKTPEDEYRIAKAYYEKWMEKAEGFLDTFRYTAGEGRLNESAFHLHQAAERAYHCLILVQKLYSPPTHNLNFLRTMTEPKNKVLRNVFPQDNKKVRRAYQRLKRAYVEARYSEHYEITHEELAWLSRRVKALHTHVRELCEVRLAELQGKE